MSFVCIKQAYLAHRSGSSDKVYVVQLNQDGANYEVRGYNGRRGGSLTAQRTKYSGTSLSRATDEFNSLVDSKLRHPSTPYHEVTGSTPTGMPTSAPVYGGPAAPASAAASTPPGRSVAADAPQLMLPIKADLIPTELSDLIESDNWVMQQKYDGTRSPVRMSRASIVLYNKLGVQSGPSTEVAELLSPFQSRTEFNGGAEMLMDAELMGTELVVYDLIEYRGRDVRALPFVERYTMLEDLFEGSVVLAPVAWTKDEKLAMQKKAQTNSWEGLILRDMDSPYVPGRTRAVRRHKQWASCTARVLGTNLTKRSIRVGLLENEEEVFVGNVTIPVNQPLPEDDSLVEVRYLYAHSGGSLYQPVYVGPRDDAEEADERSTLRSPPPEKLVADPVATEVLSPATAGVPVTEPEYCLDDI